MNLMIKKLIAAKSALKKKVSTWRKSADSFLEKWEREHAPIRVKMTSLTGTGWSQWKIKEVDSQPWGSSITVSVTNFSSKSKWIYACCLNVSFGKNIRKFQPSAVGEFGKIKGYFAPLNQLMQSQKRVNFKIPIRMSEAIMIMRQSEGEASLIWAEVEMETGEKFHSDKKVFIPEYPDMARNRY